METVLIGIGAVVLFMLGMVFGAGALAVSYFLWNRPKAAEVAPPAHHPHAVAEKQVDPKAAKKASWEQIRKANNRLNAVPEPYQMGEVK